MTKTYRLQIKYDEITTDTVRTMKRLIISVLIILISTQAYAVRFKTQLNVFEVVAVCIYRNVMFVTINLNGSTSSVMTTISCNQYKKGKFKPLLLNHKL